MSVTTPNSAENGHLERQIDDVLQMILSAKRFLLSIHRNADGDGLGAQVALFHELKNLGKSVRILNVDAPSSKYRFLTDDAPIQAFDGPHDPVDKTDLALIFDTNDSRLVEPLYSELKKQARDIVFIDHHPLLKDASKATAWIDTNAASTGELGFRLIKKLLTGTDLRMSPGIAAALYTSVVFDTQLFKFIRRSPASHLMAAELLETPFDVESIHRDLFASSSAAKFKFLSRAANGVEYSAADQIAFVSINSCDIEGVTLDETSDLVDMMINIDTVEVAALLREESAGHYKLSLRSKGLISVLPAAETFGGGGHPFAAGAYLTGAHSDLRERILTELRAAVESVSAGQGSRK